MTATDMKAFRWPRWRGRLVSLLRDMPPWLGVLLAVLVYLSGYSAMTP